MQTIDSWYHYLTDDRLNNPAIGSFSAMYADNTKSISLFRQMMLAIRAHFHIVQHAYADICSDTPIYGHDRLLIPQ